MIENFLRPPHGPAETGADVLRGVGVLSVILAAILFDLTDAGVLAFALPGLFVPRFLGMLPWPDVVVSTTLLIAAWSNVFDLYRRIPWWDLAVHFAGAGVLAAVLYLLLARVLVVTAPHADGFTGPAAVVMTTSFSLALSALWEMVEWLGHAFISAEIFVGYDDTIGDMAVGGLGGLFAGFAVAFLPLVREAPRS